MEENEKNFIAKISYLIGLVESLPYIVNKDGLINVKDQVQETLPEIVKLWKSEHQKVVTQQTVKIKPVITAPKAPEEISIVDQKVGDKCAYYNCSQITKKDASQLFEHYEKFYHRECLLKQRQKEYNQKWNEKKKIGKRQEPPVAATNQPQKPHYGFAANGVKHPEQVFEYDYCANPKCPKPYQGKFVKGAGVQRSGLKFCSLDCADAYRPIPREIEESSIGEEAQQNGQQ